MKQITITLPDLDAGKFVAQLMDMNVTFTVQTTVARDPIVFAALENMPYTREEDMPRTAHAPEDPRDKDPIRVQAGLAGATVGKPIVDRRGRRVQRLTPDGRTSMQVVEAKVASFHGKTFHMREIKALAEYSGFQAQTLQNQTHILVARGKLVKMSKWTFREVVEKRASPLAPPSQPELPLEPQLELSGSEEAPAEFVTGQGWREPAQ